MMHSLAYFRFQLWNADKIVKPRQRTLILQHHRFVIEMFDINDERYANFLDYEQTDNTYPPD